MKMDFLKSKKLIGLLNWKHIKNGASRVIAILMCAFLLSGSMDYTVLAATIDDNPVNWWDVPDSSDEADSDENDNGENDNEGGSSVEGSGDAAEDNEKDRDSEINNPAGGTDSEPNEDAGAGADSGSNADVGNGSDNGSSPNSGSDSGTTNDIGGGITNDKNGDSNVDNSGDINSDSQIDTDSDDAAGDEGNTGIAGNAGDNSSNSGGNNASVTPGNNAGGSNASETPGSSAGGNNASVTPGNNAGGSNASVTPGNSAGGSNASVTPGNSAGSNPQKPGSGSQNIGTQSNPDKPNLPSTPNAPSNPTSPGAQNGHGSGNGTPNGGVVVQPGVANPDGITLPDESDGDTEKREEDSYKELVPFWESQASGSAIITVLADAGVFPKGSRLVVRPVVDAEKETVLNTVPSDELKQAGKQIGCSFVWDIYVETEDGVKIQPDKDYGSVNVSFKVPQIECEILDTDVYHLSSDGAISGRTLAQPVEILNKEGDALTISADSFSYYILNFSYSDLYYAFAAPDYVHNVFKVMDVLKDLNIPVGPPSEGVISDVTSSSNATPTTDIFAEYLAGQNDGRVKVFNKFEFSKGVTLTVTMSNSTVYTINVSGYIGDHVHHNISASPTIIRENVFDTVVNNETELRNKISTSSDVRIYLNADISLHGSDIIIPSGKKVAICLNGHEIRQTDSGSRVFTVKNGGTLSIDDCEKNAGNIHTITYKEVDQIGGTFNTVTVPGGVTGGVITGGNAVGANATGGGILNEGTLYLFGGTICGNYAATGAVQTGGGGIFNKGTGVFYMLGGAVSYNTTNVTLSAYTSCGGGGIMNTGTMEIYGGSIENNKSYGFGGGICVSGAGKLEKLENVTIEGNISYNYSIINTGKDVNNSITGSGGGIYIDANTACSILDVKINNNTATVDGGGIFIKTSKPVDIGATALGECIFDGNIANHGGGGGICSRNGVQIENVVFTGNSAVFGAGIYLNASGAVSSITACEMNSNSADGNLGTNPHGGAIQVHGDANTVTITDCILDDNNILNANNGYGAGISVDSTNSNFYVYGGSISNNGINADSAQGAAIHISGSGNAFTIDKNGSSAEPTIAICNNKSAAQTGMAFGGAIYVKEGNSLSISNAEIKGNEVASYSSDNAACGAAVYALGNLEISDSMITNNSAAGSYGSTEDNGYVIKTKGNLTLLNTEIKNNKYTNNSGKCLIDRYAVFLDAKDADRTLYISGKVVIDGNVYSYVEGGSTKNENKSLFVENYIDNHLGTPLHKTMVDIMGELDPDSMIGFNLIEIKRASTSSYVATEIKGRVTNYYIERAYGATAPANARATDFFTYEGDTSIRHAILRGDGQVWVGEGHVHANTISGYSRCYFFDIEINNKAELASLFTSGLMCSGTENGKKVYNIFLSPENDADDIIIDATWEIPADVIVNLCLNDHGIVLKPGASGSVIRNLGTLAIYDCDADHNPTSRTVSCPDKNGGVAFSGTVTGGVIAGGNLFSGDMNGGAGIQNGIPESLDASVLYLYDGTICGNTVANACKSDSYNATGGGGVYNSRNSTFHMYGGDICYNSVTSIASDPTTLIDCFGGGGGIFTEGILACDGGAISYNYAVNNGGGILIQEPGTSHTTDYIFDGVTISHNKADMRDLTPIIVGAANRVGGSGGGLYANGAKLTIKNAAIDENIAMSAGGGLFSGERIHNLTADMTLTSCKIRNNRATTWGGGALFYGDNFVINGSDNVITGNMIIAEDPYHNTPLNNGFYGAGIYAGENLRVVNAEISNNVIDGSSYNLDDVVQAYGGGIYCFRDLYLNGVNVNNNIVSGQDVAGAGVYTNGENVEIKYSEICGNELNADSQGKAYAGAESNAVGAGLYAENSVLSATIENTDINQNSAVSYSDLGNRAMAIGAGVYVCQSYFVPVSGAAIFNGCDISQNKVESNSGEIEAYAAGIFGNSRLELIDSTVTQNEVYNSSTAVPKINKRNAVGIYLWDKDVLFNDVEITDNKFYGPIDYESCGVLIALESAAPTFDVSGRIIIRDNYNQSNREYCANNAIAATDPLNLGQGNLFLVKKEASPINDNLVNIVGTLTGSDINYNLFSVDSTNTANLISERGGQVTNGYSTIAYPSIQQAVLNSYFHYEGSYADEILFTDGEIWISVWHVHEVHDIGASDCRYFERRITSSAQLLGIGSTLLPNSQITISGQIMDVYDLYLGANVTLTDLFVVPENTIVNLCLNGYALSALANSGNGVVLNRGTLRIFDCNIENKTPAQLEHTIMFEGNPVVVSGGVITGGNTIETSTIPDGNGGFEYGNAGAGIRNNGKLTMYGGTICGNECKRVERRIVGMNILNGFGGGGVFVDADAEFYMYSGAVSYNTVSLKDEKQSLCGGGGIYSIGMLEIAPDNASGAPAPVISHNSIYGPSHYLPQYNIGPRGGGIFASPSAAGNGKVHITGSTIEYNFAESFESGSNYIAGTGGGIAIMGTFDILIDGCEITNNEASSAAGLEITNHFYNGPAQEIIVNNCNISSNKAHKRQGGANIAAPDGIKITNCKFNQNTATSSAGMAVSGKVSIENCEINENISNGGTNTVIYGAGLYCSGISSVIDIKDTTIERNEMTGNSVDGAGVYSDTNLTMTRCSVSGNKQTSLNTSAFGAGIYLINDYYASYFNPVVTLNQVNVNDNEIDGKGGAGSGIYIVVNSNGNLYPTLTLNMNSCNVNGNAINTAGRGAGICAGSAEHPKAIINLTDTNIQNNKLFYKGSNGAGIYSSEELNINGGNISGNEIINSVGGYVSGAGMYLYNGDTNTPVVFTDVNISENKAITSTGEARGGAMYIGRNISAQITGCTINANEAWSDAGTVMAMAAGIEVIGNAELKDSFVTNNIVRAPSASYIPGTDNSGYNGSGIRLAQIGASANDIGNLSLNNVAVTGNRFEGPADYNYCGLYVSYYSQTGTFSVEGAVKITDNKDASNNEKNLYLVNQNGATPAAPQFLNLVVVKGDLKGSVIGYDIWKENDPANVAQGEDYIIERSGQVTRFYETMANSIKGGTQKVDDYFIYQGIKGEEIFQLVPYLGVTQNEVWVITHFHEWEYIENGNKILAHCVAQEYIDECDYANNYYEIELSAVDPVIFGIDANKDPIPYTGASYTDTGILPICEAVLVHPTEIYEYHKYNVINGVEVLDTNPLMEAPSAPGKYEVWLTISEENRQHVVSNHTARAIFNIIDDGKPFGFISLIDYDEATKQTLGSLVSWSSAKDYTKDTLKHFYNSDKYVEVYGEDLASPVCYIYYQVSDIPLSDTDLQNSQAWIAYSEPFKLAQNCKKYIYAMLVDPSDNVKYISTEGVEIYTDSAAIDTEKGYSVGSGTDLPYEIKVGENTVNNIKVTGGNYPANTVLTEGVDYTISYGTGIKDGICTITLAESVFDGAVGTDLVFTMESNPSGEIFIPSCDCIYEDHSHPSDEPAKTDFTVHIDTPTFRLYTLDASHQLIAEWKDDSDKTEGGKRPYTIFRNSGSRLEIYNPGRASCDEFYLLSDAPIDANDLSSPLLPWNSYTNIQNGVIVLQTNQKLYAYVKLVYASGTTIYMSSEGIVLYTDAAVSNDALVHTISEKTKKTKQMLLNGQVISEFLLDGKPVDDLVKGINISQEDGIVFAPAYLDKLDAGMHTVLINYLPYGEIYFDDSDMVNPMPNHYIKNDAPLSSAFDIDIRVPVWNHKYLSTISINNGILSYRPMHDVISDDDIKNLVIANIDDINVTEKVDESGLPKKEDQILLSGSREKAKNAVRLGPEADAFDGANVDAKLELCVAPAEEVYEEDELEIFEKIVYDYLVKDKNKEYDGPDNRNIKVEKLLDLSLSLTYDIFDLNGELDVKETKLTDISDEALGDGNGFAENVTITLPTSILTKTNSGRREYYIIRVHEIAEGNYLIEKLPVTAYRDQLTFSTDLFSVYALAYEDEGLPLPPIAPNIQEIIVEIIGDPKDEPDAPEPPTIAGPEPEPEEIIESPEQGHVEIMAPQTGDHNYIKEATILAMISSFFMAFLAAIGRKKKEEKDK